MSINESDISCGVSQLSEISSISINNLSDLGNAMYNEADGNCAFIIWSDIWGKNKPGNRLYHYIKKEFPKSHVQRTAKAVNPNSKNTICVYTWKIPREFKRWWKDKCSKTI